MDKLQKNFEGATQVKMPESGAAEDVSGDQANLVITSPASRLDFSRSAKRGRYQASTLKTRYRCLGTSDCGAPFRRSGI